MTHSMFLTSAIPVTNVTSTIIISVAASLCNTTNYFMREKKSFNRRYTDSLLREKNHRQKTKYFL